MTSEDTELRPEQFAIERLGRDALLIPYIVSAIRMYESGFATRRTSMSAWWRVAGQEFKDPLYAAPPLLARMVDAGLIGRKAG